MYNIIVDTEGLGIRESDVHVLDITDQYPPGMYQACIRQLPTITV